MDFTVNFSRREIDKALENINLIEDPKARIRAFEFALEYVSQFVEEYPPAPVGSRWKRGTGFINADGTVGKKSVVMSARWSTDVTAKQGELSNNTTYLPYVIGDDQAWFHARNGWINAPKWFEDNKNQIARQWVKALGLL